jgi:hypothetical protein
MAGREAQSVQANLCEFQSIYIGIGNINTSTGISSKFQSIDIGSGNINTNTGVSYTRIYLENLLYKRRENHEYRPISLCKF